MTRLNWGLSSSTIHGLTLQEAYHKLDDEISQLQERLSSLRSLRNSLAPISKVPTEILSKIFSHTQEHGELPLYEDLDITTRFYVSWVCRHWRNTAVTTPSLWTVISKKSRDVSLRIDFVEALLSRSRPRALVVGLFEPSVEVLKACLPQMCRIQHLRLLSAPRGADFSRLLIQPAPLLASLDLELNSPVQLPFAGVYPHLFHLTVRDTAIHSNFPLTATTITNFRIINPTQPIVAQDLIDILSSLPNLTDLILEKCFPNEVGVVPATRISRPHLQAVSIVDHHLETLFSFLELLDIPQAAVSVTWPEELIASEDELKYFSIILDHYRVQISLEVRHLEIKHGNSDFSVHLSSTPLNHRYSFCFPQQEFSSTEIDALFFALPISDLQTLSANTLTNSNVSEFQELTNLKSIALHGIAPLQELVLWGGLDPEEDWVPFSALEELSIYEVKQQFISEVDSLHRALSSRHLRGLGLAKLVIAQSPAVDVDRFKDIVGALSVVD
ncbi:hypothetical protein BDN72DRAFT_429966 [Pluteus cervinus]|uniref:Uncharacterized protein n=1 Tax=Pluteus cervinus TaxID=181527 RepID=A0ACD3A7C6_9AGAR|nr:hypothetical protein BDN72DRAFT_429966 [Pluteus cervinus]